MLRDEKMMRGNQTRHTVHGAPTSERRVGSVGLLIIQAAKQGSRDNLEFLLNLPGGTSHPTSSLVELRTVQ